MKSSRPSDSLLTENPNHSSPQTIWPALETPLYPPTADGSPLADGSRGAPWRAWTSPMMGATTKVRLRFAKEGDLRLVSHHDLMRCLERTLRRTGLPVARSRGFNPRPRVVFALALALGIAGRREVVDLELSEPMEPSEVLQRLRDCAPPGLTFLEAEDAGPGRPAPPRAVRYQIPVPPARWESARAALAEFLATDRWPYQRRRADRTIELDLRPFVLGAELDPEGLLRFRMKIDPAGSARPEELLEALHLRDLIDSGTVLVREDIELATDQGPDTKNLAAGSHLPET